MNVCANVGRNVVHRRGRHNPYSSAWDPRLLPRCVRSDPGEREFRFILVLNDDQFPNPGMNDWSCCLICNDKVWHNCVRPNGKWWFLCEVRECVMCNPWHQRNTINLFERHETTRSIAWMGIYHCQLEDPEMVYSLPRVDEKTFEAMLSKWPFHAHPIADDDLYVLNDSVFKLPSSRVLKLIYAKRQQRRYVKKDFKKSLATTIQVFGPESQYEGEQLHEILVKNRVSWYKKKKELKMLKRCFRKWRRTTTQAYVFGGRRQQNGWNH